MGLQQIKLSLAYKGQGLDQTGPGGKSRLFVELRYCFRFAPSIMNYNCLFNVCSYLMLVLLVLVDTNEKIF